MENIVIRTKEDVLKCYNEDHSICAQKVEIVCEKCGKLEMANFSRLMKYENGKRIFKGYIYCYSCVRKLAAQTTKQVMLAKYGVENIFQTEQCKKKIKNTLLKKYGVEYSSQSKIWKEKVQEKIKNRTIEEKKRISEKLHNAMTPEKMMKSITKRKKTCLEKYGTETPYLYGSIEFKNLMLKKYGVEHSMQLEQTKEKARKTFKEKYGSDWISKSSYFKDKIKEKYGTTSFSYRYFYDNIHFDSSWELYFYVYHKCLNHNIEREPCYFNYEVNGKQKRYYPDFKVDNEFYEVKSPFFFKDRDETKEMIDPFSSDQSVIKAKYEVMKKNNIHIISSKEINPIIDFLKKEGFTKKYFSSFRTNFHRFGHPLSDKHKLKQI